MTIHVPAVNGEPAEAALEASLPDALPVLPLRDTVAFPDTMLPLARPDDTVRRVRIEEP